MSKPVPVAAVKGMIDWYNILNCKKCNISDYLLSNPYEHNIYFNIFSVSPSFLKGTLRNN